MGGYVGTWKVLMEWNSGKGRTSLNIEKCRFCLLKLPL